MSRDFLSDYLQHSWGKKPEQKAREKEYNAEYYRRNKERWQQYYKKALYEAAQNVKKTQDAYNNDYAVKSMKFYEDKYNDIQKDFDAIKTENDILYSELARDSKKYKKLMNAYKKDMALYKRGGRNEAQADKAREMALSNLKAAGELKRSMTPKAEKFKENIGKMKSVDKKLKQLTSSATVAANKMSGDKTTMERLNKLNEAHRNAIENYVNVYEQFGITDFYY